MASYGHGPTLALRQRRAARTIELAGGALPPEAVLRRASGATRVNSDGSMTIAGVDVPRFDHDPTTLALRGLMIEGAATNLMLQSEALEAAGWTTPAAGAVIASNVALAPTGAMTADKLIETTTTAQHYLRQMVSGDVAIGAPYVLSFYAKAVERASLLVRMTGAAAFAQVQFDLSNVSIRGVTTGAGTIASAGPAGGGGWCRVAMTGVADAATVDCRIFLADMASMYAGDGTSGMLIHGVQIEVGSVASSPIATTSVPAGRAADQLTLNWRARGVPDGAATARYEFDDGSTQDVATIVVNGVADVPVTLMRQWLRRVTLI